MEQPLGGLFAEHQIRIQVRPRQKIYRAGLVHTPKQKTKFPRNSLKTQLEVVYILHK